MSDERVVERAVWKLSNARRAKRKWRASCKRHAGCKASMCNKCKALERLDIDVRAKNFNSVCW